MIKINLDDVKTLKKGMNSYQRKAMTVIHAYGKSSATTIANDAKRDAKWRDITGTARRSITGTYIKNDTSGIIRLEGYAKKPNYNASKDKKGWGVDYFQHLELHHNKRHAILRPSAEKALPRVSRVMANRISKIRIMGE